MVGDAFTEAGDVAARAAAFRTLADRHLDASYRLAYAILGNPAEAQDATHDAFVQAWRRWASLRDPDRFEQWFSKILVNTCRNRLRRTTRWRMQDLSSELSLAQDDSFNQSNDRDVLRGALAGLSADHRLVVTLRYYRDLSIDEIARQVGVRPGTVNSRLHYALRRMRAALEEADAKETVR